MSAKLEAIRKAAERVAESHGLDVVDVELAGPAKERILRVFLEKNAQGRKKLSEEIAAGGSGLPERLVEGKLSIDQLSGVTHEDCEVFSRDFGVLLDVEDLVPGGEYTFEVSSPDLGAMHQNSKSRKTGVSTVEIALGNVERAELIPEF